MTYVKAAGHTQAMYSANVQSFSYEDPEQRVATNMMQSARSNFGI